MAITSSEPSRFDEPVAAPKIDLRCGTGAAVRIPAHPLVAAFGAAVFLQARRSWDAQIELISLETPQFEGPTFPQIENWLRRASGPGRDVRRRGLRDRFRRL